MTHKDNTEIGQVLFLNSKKVQSLYFTRWKGGLNKESLLVFNFSDPSQKGPKADLVF